MASQDVKEELTSIFLKLFQKNWSNALDLISPGQHYRETKTSKRYDRKKKKKLQANTTDEHRCNNLYGDIKWCSHYGK